jgi:hypothetical protein
MFDSFAALASRHSVNAHSLVFRIDAILSTGEKPANPEAFSQQHLGLTENPVPNYSQRLISFHIEYVSWA